jgi:ribosomal-protein-alanine N-acetyltransferase
MGAGFRFLFKFPATLFCVWLAYQTGYGVASLFHEDVIPTCDLCMNGAPIEWILYIPLVFVGIFITFILQIVFGLKPFGTVLLHSAFFFLFFRFTFTEFGSYPFTHLLFVVSVGSSIPFGWIFDICWTKLIYRRKMYHIQTERLALRKMTPEDASFAFELNSDPKVVQYTGDGPFESVEAARTFLENYSDYERNGFGRWAVVLKNTDETIGWCGLKRDRETGEIDLGYRFLRKHWNKGYASEAAIACLDAGFRQFAMDRIVGRARKENVYSIRILEKVGMQHVADFEEDGESWVLYEMLIR